MQHALPPLPPPDTNLVDTRPETPRSLGALEAPPPPRPLFASGGDPLRDAAEDAHQAGVALHDATGRALAKLRGKAGISKISGRFPKAPSIAGLGAKPPIPREE